jgi:hypothetical protein
MTTGEITYRTRSSLEDLLLPPEERGQDWPAPISPDMPGRSSFRSWSEGWAVRAAAMKNVLPARYLTCPPTWSGCCRAGRRTGPCWQGGAGRRVHAPVYHLALTISTMTQLRKDSRDAFPRRSPRLTGASQT